VSFAAAAVPVVTAAPPSLTLKYAKKGKQSAVSSAAAAAPVVNAAVPSPTTKYAKQVKQLGLGISKAIWQAMSRHSLMRSTSILVGSSWLAMTGRLTFIAMMRVNSHILSS
jgi:hypothetical protein